MSRRGLPVVVVAALGLVAGLLAAPAPASADVRLGPPRFEIGAVRGYFYGTVGLRYSSGTERAGAALSLGAGIQLGPFGLELEGGWSGDGAAPKDRVAARSLNRLNLWVGFPLGKIGLIGPYFGPGLGWVKPPGNAEDVGGRIPSTGFGEGVRLEFVTTVRKETIIGFGVRIGATHLWQSSVVPSPDHAFDARALFTLGGAARLRGD
jgi:hypothetical protein